MEDYAEKSQPLRHLVKKDVPFRWTEKEQEVFDNILRGLDELVIHSHPIPGSRKIVKIKVHENSLSASCKQQALEELLTIENVSRTLSDTEKRYSETEKELLAIVFALNKFLTKIHNSPVTLIVKNRLTKKSLEKKHVSDRIDRLVIQLPSDLDFEIIVEEDNRGESTVYTANRESPYNIHGWGLSSQWQASCISILGGILRV